MFQGNWKCSSCEGTITELPFEPRSEEGLTCRDCYNKQKEGTQQSGESVTSDAGAPATSSEKPAFTGDWKCADCSGAITSLPFEPSNTSNLKCIDCFKKGKNS